FRLEFSTVGELIGPRCQRSPMDVGRLSEPPIDRLWHELQEMKPDFERRGSKKSFLPSSALPRSICFGGRIGVIGSSRGLDGGEVWAIAVAARAAPAARAIVAAMDLRCIFRSSNWGIRITNQVAYRHQNSPWEKMGIDPNQARNRPAPGGGKREEGRAGDGECAGVPAHRLAGSGVRAQRLEQ